MKPIVTDIEKFLSSDKFKTDTLLCVGNKKHLIELENVKQSLRDYLNQPADANKSVAETFDAIKNLMIRIKRLRFIIQPQFKFVKQSHTGGRYYALVRADWITDEGKIGRMVTKAFGRIEDDEYNFLKTDPATIAEATNIIKSVLYKKYLISLGIKFNRITFQ